MTSHHTNDINPEEMIDLFFGAPHVNPQLPPKKEKHKTSDKF